MYKALNSNNHVVADVTLYELQRPKRGGNTYYSKAMQWLREKQVSIRAVSHYHAATSTVRLTHNPHHSLVPNLFTDASEQNWWGGSYILLAETGKIMAQGCMRFATVCADSSLIESTVIAAVLHALDTHNKPSGVRVRAHVWSDSLNAVMQHAHQRCTQKLGHIGDRLVQGVGGSTTQHHAH